MTSPVAATEGLLDRAWDVSPGVSVRPERFGALLYHFGTRRLSFLKDRRLLEVVRALPASASAREACRSAGIAADEIAVYERALAQLAATDMLQERP
jgi:putative mycofactocin binding protein MftB